MTRPPGSAASVTARLVRAIERSDPDGVRFALANGADPHARLKSFDGASPVWLAVRDKNPGGPRAWKRSCAGAGELTSVRDRFGARLELTRPRPPMTSSSA